MTDEEWKLWFSLRNYEEFPARFRRQHPIGPYIVDFYSRKAKIVIELDGVQHAEKKNQEYDRKRDTYLSNLGFLVLRFWNIEINHEFENVLHIIWQTCDARIIEHPTSHVL